jgi:hypothetical protein
MPELAFSPVVKVRQRAIAGGKHKGSTVFSVVNIENGRWRTAGKRGAQEGIALSAHSVEYVRNFLRDF